MVALQSALLLPLHSKGISLVAFDTAYSYIGEKEKTYNSSPFIDKVILNGGGKLKQSYCMYFVYYNFTQASKVLNVKNPLKRTGSCSEQLKYANSIFSKGIKVIKTNQIINSNRLNRGAIAIFKRGTIYKNDIGKIWLGHTGILDKQMNKNEMILIEANTNDLGSRNGNGIYRKHRKVNNSRLPIIAFIEVK